MNENYLRRYKGGLVAIAVAERVYLTSQLLGIVDRLKASHMSINVLALYEAVEAGIITDEDLIKGHLLKETKEGDPLLSIDGFYMRILSSLSTCSVEALSETYNLPLEVIMYIKKIKHKG